MMTEEAFLRAMRATPEDADLPLVFADWLEEQGEKERSELIRLRHQLTSTPDCPLRPTKEARLRELVAAGVPLGAVHITNAIDMPLALVHAGRFLMGSPEGEPHRLADEGPRFEVAITRPFYLGVYPVTQRQYERVMGTNPAYFRGGNGGGPDHPIEQVTWHNANDFCTRLTQLPAERAAGRVYRLPSEAQWEYACRAGTTSAYHVGDTLTPEQATFDSTHAGGITPEGLAFDYSNAPGPRRTTTRVGAYPPNPWGLYDMHGNVWEWCQDYYDARFYQTVSWRTLRVASGPPGGGATLQRTGPVVDPVNDRPTGRHSIRGGAWREPDWKCRSASREGWPVSSESHLRYRDLGFRVLCLATNT
ncbi:MAG: SUMF1/EgtB/PvdO family nonheme iron enzyme [Gemmataceae bacterium]|nr:SUMF1/EgtB/PvdO family nonheme iron enzyme [Gemmataceae bacterium]